MGIGRVLAEADAAKASLYQHFGNCRQSVTKPDAWKARGLQLAKPRWVSVVASASSQPAGCPDR